MLKDKIIVVTGGAGLLGRHFVKAIVENGGIGVIADINAEAGNKTVAELSAELGDYKVVFYQLDITSAVSIQLMISVLKEKYGKIDAVVNNAYPRNKNYGRDFPAVTFPDFSENMSLHAGGYFLMMQQMGMYFKEQGYGNIVNMSSVYGVIAPRFELYEEVAFTMPVEYAAIKSAIIHLTKYAAKYFKKSGIRVNAISPGGIFDNQDPAFLKKYNDLCSSKGMLLPADITGTLVFLLSDASRYINGQNIIVDDGFTL